MLAALAMAAAVTAAPVETFVEIPGGPGPLKGTMLAPAAGSKAPAIVILPGSGPTDRDGNSPLGIRGSTYRLLAEGLAAQGVTTVRVDKRGMFASAAASDKPDSVTVVDLAADANAWAAKLKTETGAKCVWLLGHSEGGLVALIAAQDGKDLCGILLVSASGERLSDTLRRQLKAAPGMTEMLPVALHALDELDAGRTIDGKDVPPALASLFRPSVQQFLIVNFRQDPTKLVAAYGKPVLILQGDADIQITVDDARKLATAQPKAKLVVVPGANHVLKTGTTDFRQTIANYGDPSLPLAPGVVEAIAGFVKGQPGTN